MTISSLVNCLRLARAYAVHLFSAGRKGPALGDGGSPTARGSTLFRAGFEIRASLTLLAGTGLLALLPLASTSASAETTKDVLRVLVANTAAETGVMKALVDTFEKHNPDLRVELNSRGTLTVLDHGRAGRADVLLTHYPPGEALLIEEGHAVSRTLVMYNRFAFFGPHEDPLEIAREPDLRIALQRLAEAEVDFLSPSWRSGTFKRLDQIWSVTGITPDWLGYEISGNSAANTLVTADRMGTYTFADMATYLARRAKLSGSIVPLYRDHVALHNYYHALVVDGERFPQVNEAGARRFVDFLVSSLGQDIIGEYGRGEFGVQVYTAAAHLDSTLQAQRVQGKMREQNRFTTVIALSASVVSVLGLFATVAFARLRRIERAQMKEERRAQERLRAAHEVAEEARGRAEAASQAKSEFLARVSHEIRTPMNGVLGMTELLLGTELEGRQHKHVRAIKDAATSLLTIINDILDFSKVEAGRMELQVVDFDLSDLVEDVVDMLAPVAHGKSIGLQSQLPLDIPSGVRGDPGRLRQVLVNLIGNAIKFTERGNVFVSVEHALRGDDSHFAFQIIDTGIGIHQDDTARVFEMFSQADGSYARAHEGTGLGLSISKQLVDLMGGEICLDSQPGRGTTVSFTCCLERATEPAELSSTAGPASTHALRTAPVLIASDCERSRQVLFHYAQALGMRADVVGSVDDLAPQLAAQANRGDPYRIVIAETAAPGSTSRLTSTLRSTPGGASLGVVYLQRGDSSDLDACSDRGVVMLSVPIRAQALQDALIEALGNEPRLETTPPASRAPELGRGKILVVDDNELNQAVAEEFLLTGGYDVDVVGDGRAALQITETEAFDLILMDCHMPIMSGLEATRELRRREREQASDRIPIIALTANAVMGAREECIEAGMDDFLSKPYDRTHLCTLVHDWLRRAGRTPFASKRAS